MDEPNAIGLRTGILIGPKVRMRFDDERSAAIVERETDGGHEIGSFDDEFQPIGVVRDFRVGSDETEQERRCESERHIALQKGRSKIRLAGA